MRNGGYWNELMAKGGRFSEFNQRGQRRPKESTCSLHLPESCEMEELSQLLTKEPAEAPGLGPQRDRSQMPYTGLPTMCPKPPLRTVQLSVDHLIWCTSVHTDCNLSSAAQPRQVLPRQLRLSPCPGGILPLRAASASSSSNLSSSKQLEAGRAAGQGFNLRTSPLNPG